MDLFHAIKAEYLDDFKAAMDTDDKTSGMQLCCPSWIRSLHSTRICPLRTWIW